MTKSFLQHFRTHEKGKGTETIMNTQCPFCSVQCTMEVVEQRIVERKKFKSSPTDNPTSEGRSCIKGINAHEHAVKNNRIKYPLVNQNGTYVRTSWEEALSVIKEQVTDIQQQDGNDALAVYGGGSLTNEEAYLLGKFARVGLQTKHIDYNGRFCMSSAASAAKKAFGIDRGFTNQLSEIADARCIILAGTNIAECQPTLLPYFKRAKKNGAFIITIDPRKTMTSNLADLHLTVKPGMDATLVNAFLKVILQDGLLDETFIKTRTNGFTKLKQHVADVELDEISKQTGVSLEDIRLAAKTFAQAPTGMVFTARGVEQQSHGYLTVRNFVNLLLVTGKIGKKGSGYCAVTGQGNGQGGREHGQKSDQLPGYRSIENPEHRQYIANVWGIDETDLPGKGVSAYEMFEKIHEGEITGMIVVGSNPVVSNPNAHFIEEALKKLKYLVVVDLFQSETAKFADMILPTTSYLENEGTMTNMEGRVTLRRTARKPPDEVKHDWQIVCDIAKTIGKGQYFSYHTAEEIFNELRAASRGGQADYYGITYERLNDERIYWPCPATDHPGTSRLFEKSFATPDGKAQFLPVANQSPSETPDDRFPLHLTTGRLISHYLTGVQTRNTPALLGKAVEPFLEIHPRTAKKFQIKNHALVTMQSKRGSITLRSKYSYGIREDTVFVPFHWGDEQCINRLTHHALDPTSKMPAFKVCAVNVKPAIDLTLH